jgi:sulfur relay (sulfurtransferase) complex TusBCD TusD component (DsrE family)
LEDVRKAYMDGVSNGHNFGYPAIDHTDKYIQSLQQPTEIDVEIKMEPCFYDQSLGGFSTSYTEDKPKEQPKLDENGCLILKKA